MFWSSRSLSPSSEYKAAAMVAEPWIYKMRNQVSNNLKQAFFLDASKKKSTKRKPDEKHIIGILSFEVANIMSKTVHLHKSLTDHEISRLRTEILKCDSVKNLISTNESYLLELALGEKLDDLNRIAAVVSRLGKKCTEPALLGFEHIYADILSGRIDVRELGFLVKDMGGMIRKMERYVSSTLNLYNELEVLNELELASKKFQLNQHEESRRAFDQKIIWQRQDVSHLRDFSLWNQTYDKIVGLMVRTICTIYARVCFVFGEDPVLGPSVLGLGFSPPILDENGQFSGQIVACHHRHPMNSGPLRDSSEITGYNSGPIERSSVNGSSGPMMLQGKGMSTLRHDNFSLPCGFIPGRLLMECLSLSSSASLNSNDEEHVENESRHYKISNCCGAPNESKSGQINPSGSLNQVELGVPFGGYQRQSECNRTSRSRFSPKSRLMLHASPSTVGGSALALHYANLIIVIEKLLHYPHLVGDEARDDLYQMLPTSVRMTLRTKLKSYVKDLEIYDAPLAHDWKESLNKILIWLGPMAHNMIRWQTERNFEQQQIVTRTNVLLLQTLYFADRMKIETSICELLVGLNYICRYEHQQNALLDCTSSVDFDDCMDWQLQY